MHSRFRIFLLVSAFLLTALVIVWAAPATDAAPGQQHFQTETFTPTPVITAAPTITPTKPAIRNEITFPVAGDILFGFARLEGTALIDDYRQYHLHIAPANSEQWGWLTGDYRAVKENALHIFDTRLLPDGFYDLRLRALNSRGNYSESFVRGFEIRNTNPPTPTPEATRVLAEGESPLPTVSPIETPRPTAPPNYESFVPGGQGLYGPGNGDVLKSVQPIVGTVNSRLGHSFDRYELYLSRAGMNEWEWFYASQQQFFQDVIYRLDTSRIANDRYDLRLRIVYQDSNYDEFFVRNLLIDNDPALTSSRPTLDLKQPRSGAMIVGQMDIRGTLIHPQLARWELYWAAAESALPDDQRPWLLLFTGDYQVLDDLIARVDLGQVIPGRYDVRLRLVQRDGNYEDAFIRRLLVALPTATPPPSPHR